MTSRCKSYWLPGLGNDDVDPDEVIHSAFAWLRTEPCSGDGKCRSGDLA